MTPGTRHHVSVGHGVGGNQRVERLNHRRLVVRGVDAEPDRARGHAQAQRPPLGDGPDLVHDGIEAQRPDLPGLALRFVEADGQPDPVAQFVADGVESLVDRWCQAEFARVDDAAGHDELERAGTGGAGRFGEQRVVAREWRGPPLAHQGQGRVHQLVSSWGEYQEVCGTCCEAGGAPFIWVARFGLLLMPGSSSGRRASCAGCWRTVRGVRSPSF